MVVLALAAVALVLGAPGASEASIGTESFAPVSVTFVSLDTGWVLGSERCVAYGWCVTLRETTDGGTRWAPRPLPAGLVAAAAHVPLGQDPLLALGVRFADARDGWIYGGLAVGNPANGATRPVLFSTHDGGVHWQRQYPPGLASDGTIFDLEASHGEVYLLAPDANLGVALESSQANRDRWRRAVVALGDPAGGSEQSGEIVLSGANGWVVEGNDRGTTGSARLVSVGRWTRWTAPCASVGNSFAVPAAANPRVLVAVCVMGGFASPLSPAAPRGATLGSSWLYSSSNGGASFAAGPELDRVGESYSGVLASPVPGTILAGHASGTGSNLLESTDGGRRWAVVYRGELSYLGFTSESQGIGIVAANDGESKMIITHDGGRRWSRVRF
jgi:hypothetical protein